VRRGQNTAPVNPIQILESAPPSSLLVGDVAVINRADLCHQVGEYREQLKQNSFKPVASFSGCEA
jgi:hypothetical protein